MNSTTAAGRTGGRPRYSFAPDLPTDDVLADISTKLTDASEALQELRDHFELINDYDDERRGDEPYPVVTFEDVGRLWSSSRDSRMALEVMQGNLRRCEELLGIVDSIRIESA